MIQWIKDLFKSKEKKLNNRFRIFCAELFRKDIEDEFGMLIPYDFCDKVRSYIIQVSPNEYEIRFRYNSPDKKSYRKAYCYEDVKQQFLISELKIK